MLTDTKRTFLKIIVFNKMGASISSENHQEKLRECVSHKNKLIKYIDETKKAYAAKNDENKGCIKVCDNMVMYPGDNIASSSSKIDCVKSVKLNYNPEDSEKKLEWMSYKQLDDCLNNYCSIDNGNITIKKRTSLNICSDGRCDGR